MFNIDDWALSELELSLMEDIANVESDGFIWFDGQRKESLRGRHNACDILLQWEIDDHFGLQRIRCGSDKFLTRTEWRKRLSKIGEALVLERMTQIAACFPGEIVKFEAKGWRTFDLKFWKPSPGTRRIDATKECRVRLLDDETYNIPTALEKRSLDS